MTHIPEKIYLDYGNNRTYRESEIKPIFLDYQIAVSQDLQDTFLPLRLAAPKVDLRDFQSLLCVSKSLHAYIAQIKETFDFTPPPSTLNLDPDASYVTSIVNSLKPHEYLLASHILHDYVTPDDRDNRQHTNILTNFAFLSEMQHEQFINFAPILAKAPFLKGLTLRLIDVNNLEGFVNKYPSLNFIQDLILSPTRIEVHLRISTNLIKEYLPGVYNDEIENDARAFYRSANYNIARQRVIEAMKTDDLIMRYKPHFLALLHKASHVQKLIIKNDNMFVPDLEGLQANCLPKLKLLEIDSGFLTPRSMQLLLEAAPNLEELILSDSELYFDDLFLGLKPNSLAHLDRIILPWNSPNSSLSHKFYGDFGEANLTAITAAAPNLSEMRTAGYLAQRIVYIAPPQIEVIESENESDSFEEQVMDDFDN